MMRAGRGILCNSAQALIFGLPKIDVSSIIASMSSVELKKGNRLVKKLKRITPDDQISISGILAFQKLGGVLVLWLWHLKRTSGALNPRVPARFALFPGLIPVT